MTDLAKLAAPFDNGEVLQFTGRGNQVFDYIEDETVMDRLDAVLGVGQWGIRVEAISVADGIVKVTLTALGQDYEDFGYQTRDGGESLKEAVSDGIRRVGRMVGVGRYLYHKHSPAGRSVPPSRPASRPVAPVAPPPAAAGVPDDELTAEDLDALFAKPTNGNGQSMTFRQLADLAESRGVAKTEIYRQADKVFGKGTKVTDLSGEQRAHLAYEMGLTA